METSSHQQSEGNPISISNRKWEEGLASSGPQRAGSWWGGCCWSIRDAGIQVCPPPSQQRKEQTG